MDTMSITNSDSGVCDWDGTVNVPDREEWLDEDDEDEITALEGDELVESLGKKFNAELDELEKFTAYLEINRGVSSKEWKKTESNRKLGYTRNSKKTKQRHARDAHKKEVTDSKLRKT